MTIPQAVNEIILRSPFLEEALIDELINVSSLARHIKDDVKKLIRKDVSHAAIVMAINRREPGYYLGITRGLRSFMSNLSDIIVRSDLSDYTFANSSTLTHSLNKLMDHIVGEKDIVLNLSQGVYETTLVASSSLDATISNIFRQEKLIAKISGLCSLTIRLPKDNTEVSGIYYYILKSLAWDGLNVCEVVSTSNEFTLVVSSNDVHRAFEILMDLKQKKPY